MSLSLDISLCSVQISAQWHFYCGSFVSCLCVLNVWCVVAVSEYLMTPWQALHCCSSGHRVSGKTLSLVLPSVGINKGGLKPPAAIQGSSMLTIKANPSLCSCKSCSPPARLNGRCWKKYIIPCTVMLIPQLNYTPSADRPFPGAAAPNAKPCDMFAHYSPHFMLGLWMDLWSEWYSAKRQQYTMCLRSVTRH